MEIRIAGTIWLVSKTVIFLYERYINETRYYTKQVLISCDEKGKIYKVAKQLLEFHKEIDRESGN